MGLFSSRNSEDIETYREAKEELERVSRRDGYESDDYIEANDAVADAEKNVPWYRR